MVNWEFYIINSPFCILTDNLGQKATRSRSTYPTPNRLGLTSLNLGLWPRDRVQPPTFNLQPICH
ncbi:hypothetical protein [Moorena producens]|uniref:hypothetical protein n=1 Tax=Moorena producens TaxID=1155739 RepID=UPI003C77DBD8